jgi:hypothetical protein
MAQLSTVAARSDEMVRTARVRLEDAVLEAFEGGQSQRQISREVGRSQPEVARLIQRARQRRDRRWLTAAESARLVAAELRTGDEGFALRLVRTMLDTLRRIGPEDRTLFLAERPGTGNRRWDTLIRASIGWVCRELDHPAPTWTRVDALDRLWFIRPERALAGRLVQRTPSELAIVGIFIDAESLTGV